MLTMLGSPQRCCDGLTRRDTLTIGALTFLGGSFNLPVPGVQVCEHLPRTAQWLHRTALIRSVNHKAGCHNCLPSYCGFEQPLSDQHPHESDPPSMGSVCEYLDRRRAAHELPAYVYMPNW